MIYETRNHWLINEKGKKIDLTNLEHKLLLFLSNGKALTYSQLAKKLYNAKADKYIIESIRVLKYRLQKKTKLKIKSVKNIGYVLNTEIYLK